MTPKSSMLSFDKEPQKFPKLRSAELRVKDFNEIEVTAHRSDLATQASRCSQCGIPMCANGCPLENNIPDWLRSMHAGRMREAYIASVETNPFPEICGRICPQDRLCESTCVIEKGFGSVTIGAIEKYITDYAWLQGWVEGPSPLQESSAKVAIIGGGPAGLAAADRLRRLGIQVEIFDRYDRSGGLLVYGIPNFKLDKKIIHRRVQLLQSSGVCFHNGVSVGGDIEFGDLLSKFDAVLIATGVYKPKRLPFDQRGLTQALPFLTTSNKVGLQDMSPEQADSSLWARDKEVLVIGGGDTAMDCVRTSIRQGAHSVTCIYRRDQDNMPGSKKEVRHAIDEGVKFRWLASPSNIKILNDKKNLTFQAMQLGIVDHQGRRSVHPRGQETFSLQADLVIEALGFEAEDLPKMFDYENLKTTVQGTLDIDWKTMKTNLPRVFAAGDIVRGASLVVWAIRDGLKAADCIYSDLKERGFTFD